MIEGELDNFDIDIDGIDITGIEESIDNATIDLVALKSILSYTPAVLATLDQLDRVIIQHLFSLLYDVVNSSLSDNNQAIINILLVLRERIPSLCISANYTYIKEYIIMTLLHDMFNLSSGTANGLYSTLIQDYKTAIINTALSGVQPEVFETSTYTGDGNVSATTYYKSKVKLNETLESIKYFYFDVSVISKFHTILKKFKI